MGCAFWCYHFFLRLEEAHYIEYGTAEEVRTNIISYFYLNDEICGPREPALGDAEDTFY